jgi:hypothetical protein
MFIALHAQQHPQQHAIPRARARVVAMRAEADAMRRRDTADMVEVEFNETIRQRRVKTSDVWKQ